MKRSTNQPGVLAFKSERGSRSPRRILAVAVISIAALGLPQMGAAGAVTATGYPALSSHFRGSTATLSTDAHRLTITDRRCDGVAAYARYKFVGAGGWRAPLWAASGCRGSQSLAFEPMPRAIAFETCNDLNDNGQYDPNECSNPVQARYVTNAVVGVLNDPVTRKFAGSLRYQMESTKLSFRQGEGTSTITVRTSPRRAPFMTLKIDGRSSQTWTLGDGYRCKTLFFNVTHQSFQTNGTTGATFAAGPHSSDED